MLLLFVDGGNGAGEMISFETSFGVGIAIAHKGALGDSGGCPVCVFSLYRFSLC